MPSYLPENWTQIYPIYTFQVADHLQPFGFSSSTIFTINNHLNNQFIPNYYAVPVSQGLIMREQDKAQSDDEKNGED